MSEKISISAVIPVYNEESAIKDTVAEVIKAIKESGISDYEIILVDDGSTDKSGKIIDKIEGIIACHHPVNRGYGASLKTGIKKARYDWILITDADGTYPIDKIPDLIKWTNDFDMVVGARSGKNVHIPLARRPAKFILKKVAKILTGMDIPDLNSGLRIFKKDLALKFWRLYPDGFSFTTTITLASLTNGYLVKYIPINYFKRKGKSSINPIKDFVNFNVLIFKIALYFAPSRFFTPASAIVLLAAIAKAWRNIIVTNAIGDLPIILAVVAMQIFFFGLLADLVNKRMD